MEDNVDMVNLNKPFALMSDAEMNYSVPFFLSEIKKRNGDDYPAATLRHIIIIITIIIRNYIAP